MTSIREATEMYEVLEKWQDIDGMIEARNMREWEDENAEPEIQVSRIASCLGYGWGCLSDAINDHLAEACDLAEDTPVWAKIQSVIDRLEGIQDEIKTIQREVNAL